MLRQGIQSADLSWIRCNAEDKNSTGVYKVKKLNKVYGRKYRIPIDHGILNNHGAFYPKGLLNELIFELRLKPARDVVRGWDLTKLSNELTNVELEYEVINNVDLANAVTSNCNSGERFMYEHVNHHKMITVNRATDSIINEGINVARGSMRGLLFYNPHPAGARDSEKMSNPDITEVKVDVNVVLNKISSQGMKKGDMCYEVYRRFGKENSAMNITDIYAGDSFGLFVDLRSMRDDDFLGSWLKLMNTKEGLWLTVHWSISGSGSVKC